MKLLPLAKSSHSMETPAALKDKKWTRLGRRVASMLLKAIPFTAREEMIAGKKTTVFAILALQVAHQAGSLVEKKKLVIQWFGAPPRGVLGGFALRRFTASLLAPAGWQLRGCPCVVPSVPSPSDRWCLPRPGPATRPLPPGCPWHGVLLTLCGVVSWCAWGPFAFSFLWWRCGLP